MPFTSLFTSLVILSAFVAGCASAPRTVPTTTSATVDTSDPSFHPQDDGFAVVESKEPTAKKKAAPVAMPSPNHEQPSQHVHAATN